MRPDSKTLPSLWIMLFRALFIAPFRMIIIVTAVVVTTSLASFLKPKAALKVASIAGEIIWRAAGVKSVRFLGAPAPSRDAPLVVVNHISWIDFMIMGATTKFAFVMSESVSNAPVVGNGFVKLARHVDSIILDRGSEESRAAAKTKISEKLKNMMNAKSGHQERLLIFPEGTLTNGSYVVPFKLGAFEPMVPVQPLRMEYTDPHYSICDLATVEGVAFMMCLGGTDVTCTWGPIVTPSSDDTPQSLAEKTRAALVNGSKTMKMAKEGGFRDHMALYMKPVNS